MYVPTFFIFKRYGRSKEQEPEVPEEISPDEG